MYVIIEHDGERFAVWPGTGDAADIIERLPEGEPFLGIPWAQLKPGTALEICRLARPD